MAGRRVVLHEVGPRDGLQVEKTVVPTETKLRWIGALCEAGLDVVQVGSFVHPEKVPQMADTDELFRRLTAPGAERKGHAVYSGLVLNEKGLDRALACGVEMVCLGVSASETHSRKNTGMGTAEATALRQAQRRTRAVQPVRLLILPLVLLALGLWSMAPGFVAHPVAGLLWLKALVLATVLGRRLPVAAGVRWIEATRRLQLPGSWVPLAVILAIFSLRYASGVAMALQPAWRTQLSVQLPLALVFGGLSGLLLGRTLALLARVPRGAASTIGGHGPAPTA